MTPQGLEEVKERDALHAKIIAHMSLEGKRSWVRLARHTQHPAYQLKAPVRLGGQKTHPNKVCRKKLEASSGGNREQTCAEWFDRLTRDDTQPPAWKWQGPNLACEACGLKLLHTKPRIQLEHRCKVRCAARETVRYEGVHVTHQLALRNPRFQCSICGGDPSVCVFVAARSCLPKNKHTHTQPLLIAAKLFSQMWQTCRDSTAVNDAKICSRPSGRRPVWGDGLPTEL